ncbi:MAG: NADH-quinone oxidoreductase subunit NuoN [Gammaproteobacteria bacterium]|nr:NADH-quinone oxidoreductase subunit NuoN [Gammaproteobacteria bacterium]
MNPLVLDLVTAWPEILLSVGLCLVLVVDMFLKDSQRDFTYLLTILLLAGMAWVLLGDGNNAGQTTLAFGGSFISDPLARVLKLFAVAVVATVFLYSRPYLRVRGLHHGEFYVLGLFGLLGILVLASSYSLLVSYLGLEILSLSLYAMVAFNRDSPVAAEAAMKYFVLGAIASGTLLYGMSLVYGVTGTLNIADLQASIAGGNAASLSLWVGLAFLVAGIAFKFGAVPFHMWAPDVYQGAPTAVTLYVGTAPKLGALALAIRILVEGLGQPAVSDLWQLMLAALAVLSLVLGNVVAIAQTNIKRMLAYSTIAHVGFILLGFVAGSPEGIQAALFYTLVYVIMATGSFGFLVVLSSRGEDVENLDDLRGLWQRSPWFALMMVLLMVSMIGVPPLAGFYAKWWVLSALLATGNTGLAVVGLVASVIGAYYYLRIIRLMLFDDGGQAHAGGVPLDARVVLSVNVLLLVLIGLLPERLLELCARAAALI